jgi:hypothetical protein
VTTALVRHSVDHGVLQIDVAKIEWLLGSVDPIG